jgi:RNA polymerase sigma-70 factor (ECF subfamily)
MQLPDDRYREAAAAFGGALARLARAYESDPDKRLDLLQNIHLALWQSLHAFDGRCSLRTWVYRVAHNVAASHVGASRRQARVPLTTLEDPDLVPVEAAMEDRLDAERRLARLEALLHRLRPLDRQVMLLYLEGQSAAEIAEVTGLAPGNVATKIHRTAKLLARLAGEGDTR